jgi:hypothetical protein
MKYFRERHDLRAEYSGFNEVSPALRERLSGIVSNYFRSSLHGHYVKDGELQHRLSLHLHERIIYRILSDGNYDYVFEAIEIYLKVAEETAYDIYHDKILPDIQKAFDLSGSVYCVSNEGTVELRTDEDLAKKLEETKDIIGVNESAYTTFFNAVGDLFGRKGKPEDIVKNIFVAMEDYLKKETNTKDFSDAINKLYKNGNISQFQKNILEKLYAFRSDSYAVGHAGKSEKPDEVNALWFLETVIAQLKLIHRRIGE